MSPPALVPVKKSITLRLNVDVVTWLKRRVPGGRGYQTESNRVLPEYVREHGHREEGEV